MVPCLLACGPTWVPWIAVWYLRGATPWGQPWMPAMTLLDGRARLRAQRMAMVATFREPSLCRPVHRELWRNAVLDLTPIIPTACYQRIYAETYSRFRQAYKNKTALARALTKDRRQGSHIDSTKFQPHMLTQLPRVVPFAVCGVLREC